MGKGAMLNLAKLTNYFVYKLILHKSHLFTKKYNVPGKVNASPANPLFNNIAIFALLDISPQNFKQLTKG